MTKIIITLLVVCLIGVAAPQIYYNYNQVPIQPFTPRVVEKEVKVVKKVVKHKIVKYYPPTGKALELAEMVARRTGYPVDTISKIMFAESQYNLYAIHVNKNKSIDSGPFQINSIHISCAKKMGIDIKTPEGNAEFAIYLMKQNGLRDWQYSKSKWSVI